MKLAIVYPWSSAFVMTDWAENALNLERPDGFEVRWFRGLGWCPARRHIDGCEKAVDWGADLICIIGADQVHPDDLLVRLIERWKDTNGMIACLVPFRGIPAGDLLGPFECLGWKLRQDDAALSGGTDAGLKNFVKIDPRDGDLQCADVVGSGAVLFHRDILLALRHPWFHENVDPQTYNRTGDMDSRWIMRMQIEGGVKLYIDTTLDVKHLDVMKIDRTFQERFKDWDKRHEPSPGTPVGA